MRWGRNSKSTRNELREIKEILRLQPFLAGSKRGPHPTAHYLIGLTRACGANGMLDLVFGSWTSQAPSPRLILLLAGSK
jgi:hypothetical protein